MSCPQPRTHLPADAGRGGSPHALVSIDLICRDPQDRVLLGWRSNRPAQASWFVPGGRILGRTHRAGIVRIAAPSSACRRRWPAGPARSASTSICIRTTSPASTLTTHYVVLGWTLDLPAGELQAADAQHRELRWFTPAELRSDPAVHPNTRAISMPRSPHRAPQPRAPAQA